MESVARVGALALLCIAGCLSRPDLRGNGDAGADASTDGSVDAAPTQNIIFVSRVSLMPETLTSLADADALCVNDARDLPSNTYVAWLSTSTTSIRSRIMSSGGRGWVRPDGKPVADTLSDLQAGRHFYPPRLDAASNDVSGTEIEIATGTSQGGIGHYTCGDFGMTAGNLIDFGFADASGYEWTERASDGCDISFRLYCLGIAANEPVEPTPDPTHRYAFVSTRKVAGTAGYAAMDDACRLDAETRPALAGRTFLAAVPIPGDPIASRFNGSGPVWERLDGVVVLTSTMQLLAPISLDVQGQRSDVAVWAGAVGFTDSTNAADMCNGWSPSGTNGLVGDSVRSRGKNALADGTAACTTMQSVYCLQD